jgi:WD40 repeat protein
MKSFAQVVTLLAFLVVSSIGVAAQDGAIPHLLWTKSLDPPLRNDIFRARFSLDGRYLLTQDDAGLSVISRDRLTVLFRIDQPEVLEAQFTPDSMNIVFRTRSLRVERWEVATQKLVSAQDVSISGGCRQVVLSPDGKWLGCLSPNLSLKLVEVSSSNTVFEKTDFRELSYLADVKKVFAFEPFLSGLIQMQFSPNGRYFLAGTFYVDRLQAGQFARATILPRSVTIDLSNQKLVAVNDNLKRAIAGGSAFVGETKLVGPVTGTEAGGSYSFPEGKLLEKLDIPGDYVFPTTKGDTVLLPNRNLERYAKFGEYEGPQNKAPGLCMFNVADHTTSKLPGQTCLDAFDGTIAAPGPGGNLGLYNLKGEPAKLVRLAARRQTDINWAEVTPDLKWLAVTNATGGGVWNLESGERILYLPPFHSGIFGETDQFFVNYPEKLPTPRSFKRYDLNTRQVVEMPLPANGTGYYVDSVMVQRETFESTKIRPLFFEHDAKVDLLDAATRQTLWSFGRLTSEPLVWSTSRHGTLIVSFDLQSDFTKAELRDDSALRRQYDSLPDRSGVVYFRIVASRTGRLLAKLLVQTRRGETWTRSAVAAGNFVVLTDSSNDVRVFSLSDGKQVSKISGSDAYISGKGDRLAVQSSAGILDLYDLASNQKRGHYSFPAKVALVQFSPDGKRLFVLTSEQIAYLLDTTASAQP